MKELFDKVDQRSRAAEIHLTYRCNLDCPGCNRACFIKKPPIPDLTLSTFTNILDQIEELGFSKRLMIIGGEPTLHPKCLDFLRLAKPRGFEQIIWSNGYSQSSQVVLTTIAEECLGRIIYTTQKPNGCQEPFLTQTIYCSPVDCKRERQPGSLGCKWCVLNGYSVDESGITPCPIGGTVACYVCLAEARTQDLNDLLNPDWVRHSFQLLCHHCGAFLDGRLKKRPEVSSIEGTLMTRTWINGFGL